MRGPDSVMATLCSKCADRLPSAITIVQRSFKVFVRDVPSFTIGSIPIVRPEPASARGVPCPRWVPAARRAVHIPRNVRRDHPLWRNRRLHTGRFGGPHSAPGQEGPRSSLERQRVNYSKRYGKLLVRWRGVRHKGGTTGRIGSCTSKDLAHQSIRARDAGSSPIRNPTKTSGADDRNRIRGALAWRDWARRKQNQHAERLLHLVPFRTIPLLDHVSEVLCERLQVLINAPIRISYGRLPIREANAQGKEQHAEQTSINCSHRGVQDFELLVTVCRRRDFDMNRGGWNRTGLNGLLNPGAGGGVGETDPNAIGCGVDLHRPNIGIAPQRFECP